MEVTDDVLNLQIHWFDEAENRLILSKQLW